MSQNLGKPRPRASKSSFMFIRQQPNLSDPHNISIHVIDQQIQQPYNTQHNGPTLNCMSMKNAKDANVISGPGYAQDKYKDEANQNINKVVDDSQHYERQQSKDRSVYETKTVPKNHINIYQLDKQAAKRKKKKHKDKGKGKDYDRCLDNPKYYYAFNQQQRSYNNGHSQNKERDGDYFIVDDQSQGKPQSLSLNPSNKQYIQKQESAIKAMCKPNIGKGFNQIKTNNNLKNLPLYPSTLMKPPKNPIPQTTPAIVPSPNLKYLQYEKIDKSLEKAQQIRKEIVKYIPLSIRRWVTEMKEEELCVMYDEIVQERRFFQFKQEHYGQVDRHKENQLVNGIKADLKQKNRSTQPDSNVHTSQNKLQQKQAKQKQKEKEKEKEKEKQTEQQKKTDKRVRQEQSDEKIDRKSRQKQYRNGFNSLEYTIGNGNNGLEDKARTYSSHNNNANNSDKISTNNKNINTIKISNSNNNSISSKKVDNRTDPPVIDLCSNSQYSSCSQSVQPEGKCRQVKRQIQFSNNLNMHLSNIRKQSQPQRDIQWEIQRERQRDKYRVKQDKRDYKNRHRQKQKQKNINKKQTAMIDSPAHKSTKKQKIRAYGKQQPNRKTSNNQPDRSYYNQTNAKKLTGNNKILMYNQYEESSYVEYTPLSQSQHGANRNNLDKNNQQKQMYKKTNKPKQRCKQTPNFNSGSYVPFNSNDRDNRNTTVINHRDSAEYQPDSYISNSPSQSCVRLK